jgi:hypothetical protein
MNSANAAVDENESADISALLREPGALWRRCTGSSGPTYPERRAGI